MISIAGFIIGGRRPVIALSVMNGYETEVRESFNGVFAHGRVRALSRPRIDDPAALPIAATPD
jgi:ABC-type lipoprotein release transport system permease subunit